MKKIVIMGGGTGIYPVTTALKQLSVEISTIITVTDSGGSTGRIRDEFGFQPVGDLRQSLAALAEGENQEWIRKLLLYRFDRGAGLEGHNLGNLILTALQDMTGSTSEALSKAKQIFRLSGEVIPTTEDKADLKIYYEDGSTLIGEDYLNHEAGIEKQVVKVELEPKAHINPKAEQAIKSADLIIIGPGDYHASILSTILAEGTKQAFQESQAKVMLITNLMSRRYQTDKMKVSDYVSGIEETIGKKLDYILLNSQTIPQSILDHYEKNHEAPVENDLTGDERVIQAELISDESVSQLEGDKLSRSYLRHDSDKLKELFENMLLK